MSHQESNPRTPAVIAADLRRIADMLDTITGPMPDFYAQLTMQPRTSGNDAETIRVIDAVGQAIAGKDGAAEEMGSGKYHYDLSTHVGGVDVAAYTTVAAPAERERLAELAALRARVAELEARRTAAAVLTPDAHVLPAEEEVWHCPEPGCVYHVSASCETVDESISRHVEDHAAELADAEVSA